MDKNLLWDVFCETGDIEIYLKYKEKEEREKEIETCGNDGAHNERD